MNRSAFPVLALALAVGCVGPAMSISDINSARSELAAAKAADAPKLAPYEYTLADLYLNEAQQLQAYSGSYYEESYTYARKSYALAREAKLKALSTPTSPPTPAPKN
jgi:hypothetical protein